MQQITIQCEAKLGRAGQLLGGLGGEKERWTVTVARLTSDYEKLQGDVTVAAGAIAYLGPFTSTYREKIMTLWRAKLVKLGVPSNEGVDLLKVSVSDLFVCFQSLST